MKASFFFLLSGEHSLLPSAECKAILESGSFTFNYSVLDQVFIVKTDYAAANLILKRAALCHCGCLLLAKSPACIDEIIESIHISNLPMFISASDTFAVRVKRVKQHSLSINRLMLERVIGRHVREVTGAKVDLKSPNKLLLGVLSEGCFLLGLYIGSSIRRALRARLPRFRPFFTPSSMNPYLARAMVNLARASRHHILLDPFCGAGSILIEAALIGCQVVGCDLDWNVLLGAKRNLKYYGVPSELVLADARDPFLSHADRVVTDPPYGRASSTKGSPPDVLIRDFLSSAVSFLRKDGWLCIASPSVISIEDVMASHGLRIVEIYYIRVHKSLTRKIIVSRF